MCNDRSVMVNFKPGDYLPEWGRCFSVSGTGGSEEKNLYHQVCCTLQLARTLFPILANWWEKVMFPALRIFPTPFNFALFLQFKVISCAFHKHDKFGHPCYIEHTGRTDITALLKVSLTSLLFRFHLFFFAGLLPIDKESGSLFLASISLPLSCPTHPLELQGQGDEVSRRRP